MSASTINHPGIRPPGPETGRGIGVAFEASRNYLVYFTKIAEQYGDLALIKFFRVHTVFINHPEYIESVLVTNYQKFHKSPDYRALHLLLGNGLLTSEGEFWRRQRKLSSPAFHRERISAYSGVMVQIADQMLKGWRYGETLDVHQEMMHLTLDIVAKCLFSSDVTEVAHVVGAALEVSMLQYVARAKTGFLIPDWVPTPGNLRYRRSVNKLDTIIYGLIEEHKRRGQSDDLLSMLLAARDDDGNPMTDRQLRDEVMTLFLAGHETTANALSWTLYLLAQNPEAEALLHAELNSVLGGRLPGMADVPELRYTGQVVKESMRLYPPAWAIGRQAQEPFELGGYRFEKDSYVFICQYILHRDARFFPDPERFDPDRWSEEAARKVPRFAYIPFGAGPRVCIGAAFATMEATLLLATIAQRFRLALDPNHRVVPLTSITLRPKYGIRMRVGAR
jgi:cytochrome P450